MTRPGSVMPMIGCVVLALGALTVSWNRLGHAQQQYDAGRSMLLSVQSDAAEVQRLRSLRQRAAERKRPEQDMIARVHAVLQRVGLPVQTHFQSLRLESDSPLAASSGGIAYRQQSVVFMLGNLSVRQVGAFLLAWRDDQPLWSPTRIELVHVRGDSGGRARADLDRYDLTVTFSAMYVAEDGSI